MKVTIGLAQVGDDVYVVAGRDAQEVSLAFEHTLPKDEPVQITVGEVKVGRVYKNLVEPILIHVH